MAEIVIRISDRALKVTGALLILFFALWGVAHLWLSGALRAKYQLRLFVPVAEDLYVGAAVRLDGMPVGTVASVELAPYSSDSNRKIEVVLRLEKRFQKLIREDSSAALMAYGLLGEKVINIHGGFAGPPISSGGEIRVVPVREATFTDFVDALRKNADCRNDVSSPSDAKPSRAVKQSPAPHGPS